MQKKPSYAVRIGMMMLFFGGAASAGVRVQFKDNDGTPASEWMRLEFKIVNDQPAPYDLGNTTLRYYFRDSSRIWSTALWSFLINSSQADASTLTASVAPEPLLKDGWALTLKFSSGTIKANSDCWVLVGAHNEKWKVNELDDYSYSAGTAFQDDENIALYRGDERLFGPKVFDVAGNRSEFTVTSNPIISYDNRKHYSSDPVAAAIPLADGGQMLYLATSTDLYSSTSCGTDWWPPNWFESCGIDWPMDGVHLYATSGQTPANAQWIEQGDLLADNTIAPILSLRDFAAAGANTASKNMFAPDIQYVPGRFQGKMHMYIPMPSTGGTWQIGTASANIYGDGSYDTFIPDPRFFSFSHGAVFNPPASPVDPGVFPQVDSSGRLTGFYYMLYVDLTKDQADKAADKVGNISMAFLHPDMASGDFMGKVRFAAPYSHYSKLINYMEGPDVSVMRSKSGKPYYYMVFSAGEGSSLIGYAMANVDDFYNSPLYCWNFKGWIFQNLGTGNNHANLVQYNGKYYVFYHQGSTDKGNHRRQVWAKEIALIDNPTRDPSLPADGEIVGVARPPLASMENLDLYGSLNGTTTWINRATQYIRNALGSDTLWSYVTLATEATFSEGDGIYDRPLKKGSANQEWVFENVPEGTRVGSMTVPANAVRIRNMLTPDKRMTCGGAYGSDNEGTNYGLFNNALNSASANQVWVKEEAKNGPPGAYMLRNLWNNNSSGNYYLTRSLSSGNSDTYCKTPVGAKRKQMWFIE